MNNPSAEQQQMLRNALDFLRAALDLLDSAAAPAQIGAHVDLAASQLADAIREFDIEAPIIASEQSAARH